ASNSGGNGNAISIDIFRAVIPILTLIILSPENKPARHRETGKTWGRVIRGRASLTQPTPSRFAVRRSNGI
ncbi:hypothetical protein, partial [Pseudomonas aeruginosa]